MNILLQMLPVYQLRVVGKSMEPTIHDGQTVLLNRCAYILFSPEIHDVVALKDPRDKKIIIKRVTKIQDDRYFVMGDNTTFSTDSRKFGMIEKKY